MLRLSQILHSLLTGCLVFLAHNASVSDAFISIAFLLRFSLLIFVFLIIFPERNDGHSIKIVINLC